MYINKTLIFYVVSCNFDVSIKVIEIQVKHVLPRVGGSKLASKINKHVCILEDRRPSK